MYLVVDSTTRGGVDPPVFPVEAIVIVLAVALLTVSSAALWS
jgi:hypothetical protein